MRKTRTKRSIKDSLSQVVMDPAPQLTPGKFTDSFNDFIKVCLNKKVEDRASYPQLLEHPFLDSNKEVEVGGFIKEILDLPDSS